MIINEFVAGVRVMFDETCILRCQHFAMILDGDTLSLVSEMVSSRHAQASSGRAKGVVLSRFQFRQFELLTLGVQHRRHSNV